MLRGLGGGKYFGHRSSPVQGETQCTRMRCSVVLGCATGTGRVVRRRSVESGEGWMRARIVLGVEVAMVGLLVYGLIQQL